MSETEGGDIARETKTAQDLEFKVAEEKDQLPVRLNKRIGALLETTALVHDSDAGALNHDADIASRELALERTGVNPGWYEKNQFIDGTVPWLGKVQQGLNSNDAMQGAVAENVRLGLDLSKPPTDENNARLLESLDGKEPEEVDLSATAQHKTQTRARTGPRAARSNTARVRWEDLYKKASRGSGWEDFPSIKREDFIRRYSTRVKPAETRRPVSSSKGRRTEDVGAEFGYFKRQRELQREKTETEGFERGKKLSELINTPEGREKIDVFMQNCEEAITKLYSGNISEENARKNILEAIDGAQGRAFLELLLIDQKREELWGKSQNLETASKNENKLKNEIRQMFRDLHDVRSYLKTQRVPANPVYFFYSGGREIYTSSFERGWEQLSADDNRQELPWYLKQEVKTEA